MPDEPSRQALQRERELDRRESRQTAPPLARDWSTKLVGLTYVPRYPDVIHDIGLQWESYQCVADGELVELELVRQPDNEYDPNAISVRWNGEHIGHMNRVIAFRLAPELDAGTVWSCVVDEILVTPGMEHQTGISVRCTRVGR